MVDFKFYLNRQGPKGPMGDQGEPGFSPSITVDTNTANEYKLLITTADDSFTTDNLRGTSIDDQGGTYVRYNQETDEMYAGAPNYASTDSFGEVQLASDEDITTGSSDKVVTADQLKDSIEAAIQEVTIEIDTTLSTQSTNPVQNKVITEALNAKADTTSLDSYLTSTDVSRVALTGNYNDLTNKPTLGTMASKSASDYTPTTDLAPVATSGSYNDLNNKPAIPTVNDGILTIQQNGNTIGTFSANQSGNTTLNITGTSANNGTLTIQNNGVDVGTFSANQSTNTTVNIQVPKPSDSSISINYGTTQVGTFTLNQTTNQTVTIPETTSTPITTTLSSSSTNTEVPGAKTVYDALQNVSVSTATSTTPGIVQPDNSTITINNGVISASVSTPTNLVTTDTAQNITGVKTLLNDYRFCTFDFSPSDPNSSLLHITPTTASGRRSLYISDGSSSSSGSNAVNIGYGPAVSGTSSSYKNGVGIAIEHNSRYDNTGLWIGKPNQYAFFGKDTNGCVIRPSTESDSTSFLRVTTSDVEYTTDNGTTYTSLLGGGGGGATIDDTTTSTTSVYSSTKCVNTFISSEDIRNMKEVTSAEYETTVPSQGTMYVISDAPENADVNLSNLSSTGKKVIDGQWTANQLTIASATNYPLSSNITYDLSDKLPDDGYSYEILISARATTGATSGNVCFVTVETDKMPPVYIVGTGTRTNATVSCVSSAILIVGTGRQLTVVADSRCENGTFQLYLVGYRRLGNNV